MQALNISKLSESLLRLFLSSWPGFYKLLVIFIISLNYENINDAGEVAANISISQFIAIFLSSGVIALSLPRMLALASFTSYSLIIIIFNLFVSIICLVFDFSLAVLFLSIFWSYYLFFRGFFIVKDYLIGLLLIEIFGVIVFFVFTYIFVIESLYSVGVSYFCMVILLMLRLPFNKSDMPSLETLKLALYFSISNTLSSGAVLLIPYYVLVNYSGSESIIINYSLSIAMFLSLLPRTYSYRYVPRLKEVIINSKKITKSQVFLDFNKKVTLSLMLGFGLIFFSGAIGFSFYFSNELDYNGSIIAFLSLLIILSLQMSFPNFCILQIYDLGKETFYFNLFLIAFSIFGALINYYLDSSVEQFLIVIVFTILVRHICLSIYIKRLERNEM